METGSLLIKGSPFKPPNTILCCDDSRGFRGAPMMPKDGSLVDSYLSDRCGFSSLDEGRGPFRRRRLGAADLLLGNSVPCRFGAEHFGAVS